MQEEDNHVQFNSESSSTAPSDSIRAAFASLDAANSTFEALQYSSNSIHDDIDNIQSSERLPSSQLFARPVQFSDETFGDKRALIGGPTDKQMQEKAQKAIEAQNKRKSNRKQKVTHYATNNPPPPWQGIPLSPNSTQIPLEQDALFEVEHSSLPVPINSTLVDIPDQHLIERSKSTLPQIEVIATTSTNKEPKKKTLSWSARRDRRIARRRSSPPLTRRRSAAAAASVVTPTNEEQTTLPPSPRIDKSKQTLPKSVDQSAESTDPSYGSSIIVDPNQIKRIVKRQVKKKSGNDKPLAQLDMTFTDPDVAPNLIEDEQVVPLDDPAIETVVKRAAVETFSETESEDEEPSHQATPVISIESGSETEEEGEFVLLQSSEKTIKNKAPKRRSKKEISEKKQKVTKREPNFKPKPQQVPKPIKIRTKKGPPKGNPIFEGLVFVVLGYWTKVKMYENLIEKHSGILARKSDSNFVLDKQNQIPPQFPNFESPPQSFFDFSKNPLFGITHIIYCPHGAYLPNRDVIHQSIQEWYQKQSNNPTSIPINSKEILDKFNQSNFIESRWVSDCISACLNKEDLLSIESYRISM